MKCDRKGRERERGRHAAEDLNPGRCGEAPGCYVHLSSELLGRRDRLWVGLEGLGAKVARGSGRLP